MVEFFVSLKRIKIIKMIKMIIFDQNLSKITLEINI